MNNTDRSIIIYDCEIINTTDQNPPIGVQKCAGWSDFKNMGISVIGAYDYLNDAYHVFLQDNLKSFQKLVNSRQVVVGFNSIAFDNQLCKANGLSIPAAKSYDLLQEVRLLCGLSQNFENRKHEKHVSLSLEALAFRNFGLKKTGHGAVAPILWQIGKTGAVIDYCLRDVWLTKKLLDADRLLVDETGFEDVDIKYLKPIRTCYKCGIYIKDWDDKHENWQLKVCPKCQSTPEKNDIDFDIIVPF